jgi:flagellin
MSLNSVNTNVGAIVALQSLNKTNEELAVTQKRISTGYRVADSRDDGAAYAVAERVRSDMTAAQAANTELGNAIGLVSVANSALGQVSNALTSLRDLMVSIGSGTVSDEQRAQYQAQAAQLSLNISNFISDANYNSTNILQSTETQSVVRNGAGQTYAFSAYDATSCIYNLISDFSTATTADALAALTTTGDVTEAISRTLSQMNLFGSYQNYMESQMEFNSAIVDAQEGGVGALVDADLAKESARLQALQIRQQLGTQALSIANQAPSALLSLFR